MLPHKFFRIALLQETKDIINAEWFTNNNEKIKNAWKALDNQTNYVEYFDDFQATNDLRKKSGKEKKDEFKNKIKKITTLYQPLYLDTILNQICNKLQEKDNMTGLKWETESVGSLRKRKNLFILNRIFLLGIFCASNFISHL